MTTHMNTVDGLSSGSREPYVAGSVAHTIFLSIKIQAFQSDNDCINKRSFSFNIVKSTGIVSAVCVKYHMKEYKPGI